MPWLASVSDSTALGLIGAQKLGQPVPESNFCSLLKSGRLQPAHT